MTWLDAIGWGGSALLVYSLMQTRVLRLRVLNTVACVVLVFFNAMLHVWPMVAMNVVLAAINIYFVLKLRGERHDPRIYQVLEVEESESYVSHFLRVHHLDIDAFFPSFFAERAAPDGTLTATRERRAYLVVRGEETVGLVVVRDAGNGVAQVELDYVTPRYRDFTPGEFVYRQSGLFADRGFQVIRAPEGMVAPYYAHVGFTRRDGHWELPVSSATG